MSKLLNDLQNELKELDHYNDQKDVYVILYFISNVYTGVLRKNEWHIYSDKETTIPDNDIFLSGYAFNDDVQINITKDDDTGKNCFEGIESVKLNDKKYIEENMFLLSDDENYEIQDDYVKLVQGKKSVVVPQTFTENEVKSKGITLRVRNYISFDKNDFPYVSCVRLLGFYPYNGGAE